MTDFDMSKLLGNNPHLTPTFSPGTMVYMSPEALGEPPAYTRKLDIFSSGVLHVQLITHKFPDPGPRMTTVQVGEDSCFAVSQVHVEVAEVERRMSHIDLIDPTHPLLKIALDCLKDKEGQRPTAEQLCSRLAALKETPLYRDSLQPAQQTVENLGVAAEAQAEPQRELLQQNQELRQQLEEGREALQAKEREVDSLTRNMEQLQLQAQDREAEIRRKNEQIHQMGEQLRQTSEQLQERNVQIQRKEAQIQQMGEENRELRQQLDEGREALQANEREVDSLTRNMEQLQLQSHTRERQAQDREAEIRRKNEQLQERNVQIQRLEEQIQQLHQTSRDSEQLIATLQQSVEQKEKKTETCSVTIPDTCSVGESVQVIVKVPQSVGTNVQAQLKSLADPSCAMLASVAPTNADTYTITFTPRVRGRHDLTVTVNGKEIAGSPFRLFVKIHPTQLGQPVRTITGLGQPWGIAINSKQQLMVAECGGKKITIMERDGKRVQTIECDKFKWPRGVATGPDGAIYVTDSDAQCLFKFDKEGKLLKTVQNNLKSPYSVKIIRNQLYVADCSDLVQIFDTDCNVVGTIQTKECPTSLDIAVGEDGLYVVGGGGKIAVYRCAPNGEFIRHLNINPSLNLSLIYSICFGSSGHLIVGNYGGSNGVYVFQPSGEHVASLSLASSGGIQYPAGIAIDDDGFVYVCACLIGTVTVF